MEQIPQQIQHQLAQFQQTQQQAEAIANQKMQIDFQLKDTERALKEIEPLGEDAEVYKTVGSILVKTEKTKLTEELKERKETLELRLKTLKRQEEKVTARLQELQGKLQSALQAQQQKGGGPRAG